MNKNLKKIIAIAGVFLMMASFTACNKNTETGSEPKKNISQEEEIPTLSLVASGEVAADAAEEFKIDVKLSSMPSKIYPAASLNVAFDKEKLEFTGIENGTVEDYSKTVPTWTVDVEASNEQAVVKAIYLDSSSGKNSYHKSGFEKDVKDTIISLKFKLKEGANTGDELNFNIEEAVFATINADVDDSDLSTYKQTLKNENLKLVLK